jgi:hypothetical protein
MLRIEDKKRAPMAPFSYKAVLQRCNVGGLQAFLAALDFK